MAICDKLGGRCAGPLTAAVTLARANVPACADALALAAVVTATDAAIAAQAAMSLAATRWFPRRALFTARQ